MDIILNKIAIWRALGINGISILPSPKGQRYLENGSPVYLTAENGLKRYAKDYNMGEVKFSLFVRTLPELESDFVETQLDAVAKKITEEYALKATVSADVLNFEYTPFSLEIK